MPHSLQLGCIADDYTGATDLASMLVRQGLQVVQLFGLEILRAEFSANLREALSESDAIVVSLKTRSIPAAAACSMSLEALRALQEIGCTQFFFKYCSTFDSTAEGNIGPVAEALASELKQNHVWYCPAFPENGRTVYCGHLFVGGELLHESGMQNHPLNPMSDSNLVRVLQAQCRGRVGRVSVSPAVNVSYSDATEDIQNWIVDAVSEDDLKAVASAAQQHVLLTGGSAMGAYWASVTQGNTRHHRSPAATAPQDSSLPGASSQDSATFEPPGTVATHRSDLSQSPSLRETCTLVLAGSCSTATRKQIAYFERHVGPVKELEVLRAAQGKVEFDAVVAEVLQWCGDCQHYAALVASGARMEQVRGAADALGAQRAAELTEALFAAIAKGLAELGLRRMIVAGGETSGAVINALGIDAVRIGVEIAPGVPWVHSLREPSVALALKSGNFGGDAFFETAIGCDGAAVFSREVPR
ncbi:four-carbon acid sugar kinase family protein [Aureliella helgolandensis]|uniref:Four-carbon acid sugar kinase family protein n=1 Tax=Aureliella helgolandensis TaxID=2527968 RepID=A0A518GAA2_9BACT|nr:four-carbon acid sugar kinase family protein [Aureliella helgolandensis]QDV25514.1 hypothetical protein Q31a_38400 [Aureliella helgolandensis]